MSDRFRPLERALHRVGEADRRLHKAAADRLEIGVTDLDALLLLEGGPLPAGRLAEALSVTTGAVTGLVDRLERAGWVQRTRHETDRRQVVVELVRREPIAAHLALREQLLSEAVGDAEDADLAAMVGLIEAAADRWMAGATVRPPGPQGPAPDDASAPLGAAERGRLRFVSGAARLDLRGARIPDLYRAAFQGRRPLVRVEADGTVTVQYKGWTGWKDVGADLTLTAAVPWTIEIRGGVSQLTADLRELEVASIDITGGASQSEIQLPRPRGSALLRVTGGANHVVVKRPRGVEAQAIVRGGANSLTFDGRSAGSFGSASRFATAGWEGAADRWSIELTGGASDLAVTEE